jgi:CRP-like cAMP-binding protein
MRHKKNKSPEIPESVIARISVKQSESKYRGDQIIYSQGDPAVFVIYVRASKLKVAVISEGGKEAVSARRQCRRSYDRFLLREIRRSFDAG